MTLTCECGSTMETRMPPSRAARRWPDGTFKCRSCIGKKRWSDPSYRAMQIACTATPSVRKKIKEGVSSAISSRWAGGMYNEMVTKANSPESLDRSSKASLAAWADPAYRKLISDLSAQCTREAWLNEAYRNKVVASLNRPETVSLMSAKNAARWAALTPEEKRAHADRTAARWRDATYREFMASVAARQPRISSLQVTLYRLLNDLGVEFHAEGDLTVFGPWNFDCLVPKQGNMRHHLLIECQGEFWHSGKSRQTRDRAKFTYIDRYFHDHKVAYLFEREFWEAGKINNKLRSLLMVGNPDVIAFSFTDIRVGVIDDKTDLREFLDAYHYLPAVVGKYRTGAYINDKLIACCLFSPPRNRISGDLELTRLCIHPQYQKKNFGSWLISRAVATLPKGLRLVSFADTTAGHSGTVYKAANWKFDGEVEPDYWYEAEDGFVMHKQTLYRRACKLSVKEAEYASANGYQKRWGGKKLRFVFNT